MDTDAEFLNCGLVNIQSVGNKTIEIRELLNEREFDVMAITETWLNNFDSAKINEMTPPTHTFLHMPREGRVGGGVGLFTSNALSHLKMLKRINVNSFEYIEVNFKCQNQWVSFVVVYRPPSSCIGLFMNAFSALLELINMVSFKVFIVGDFNIWMDDPDDLDKIRFCELLD